MVKNVFFLKDRDAKIATYLAFLSFVVLESQNC